jgi:hypothetical protein
MRASGRSTVCRAGAWVAAFAILAHGAASEEPKNSLAAQIRTQGYRCEKPVSAERDASLSKPDQAVWVLKCEKDTYRLRLIPDMAARVERVE